LHRHHRETHAGNMRSRWRDFLTTDGEKADRNRDTNLKRAENPRRINGTLGERLEISLRRAEPLSEADVNRTVTSGPNRIRHASY